MYSIKMYGRLTFPVIQAALYTGKTAWLFLLVYRQMYYIQHAGDRKLVYLHRNILWYGCSHFSLKMTSLLSLYKNVFAFLHWQINTFLQSKDECNSPNSLHPTFPTAFSKRKKKI